MKPFPKLITLELTQNLINTSRKLVNASHSNSQNCPLAAAGKKVFRGRKLNNLFVSLSANLYIRDSQNNSITYVPRATKTAFRLVSNFDSGKDIKPTTLVYKLYQEKK